MNGYYDQRGAIGTVTRLFRIVPRDCIEYEVVADGDDVKDYQSFKRYRRDKETDPVKGHVLYEGMSKDGLIIRFWYNFDLDLIETAYPVISITEGGG